MKREAGVVSEVGLQVFKDLMAVQACQASMETRASRVVLGSTEGQGSQDLPVTEVNQDKEDSLE